LPDWEEAAIAADTEVEAQISRVIADYVAVLIVDAEQLATRLKPLRAALMSFARDHENYPSAWSEQNAFRRARQPLDAAADEVWQFFRDLRESELPVVNPWKSARERLRENPNASLLKEMVAEFDGLLDPDDDRPQRSIVTVGGVLLL
jgi:hypothetical protein